MPVAQRHASSLLPRRTPTASVSPRQASRMLGFEQNQLRFLSVNILLQPRLTVPEAKGLGHPCTHRGVGADVGPGGASVGQGWARCRPGSGQVSGWRRSRCRSRVGPGLARCRGWRGAGVGPVSVPCRSRSSVPVSVPVWSRCGDRPGPGVVPGVGPGVGTGVGPGLAKVSPGVGPCRDQWNWRRDRCRLASDGVGAVWGLSGRSRTGVGASWELAVGTGVGAGSGDWRERVGPGVSRCREG
jgi:hypothetical protein